MKDPTTDPGPYSKFGKSEAFPAEIDETLLTFRLVTQMEQFSRECLEIDEESHTRERSDSVGGASMDKVYDRAAKLVKRTLDVEGVIVMDVSHCQVLETMGSEANVAVTMHFGEPGTELKKQKLTTDEYHRLNVFFSSYPEGKISEGIIPPCFRLFLPTHIQYALSKLIFFPIFFFFDYVADLLSV